MVLAAITVCVATAGDVDVLESRLAPLVSEVRRVMPGTDSLEGCDVLAVGSGWAELGDGSWKRMEPQLPTLDAFVRAGGGLLVFQPNPHAHNKDDSLTIPLMGAPIRFENWYRSGEDVRPVREHPLTVGFEGGLPWPADR